MKLNMKLQVIYCIMYCVLYVVCCMDCRGKFEWTGDWGDDSDMWKKYPGVKLELQSILSSMESIYD